MIELFVFTMLCRGIMFNYCMQHAAIIVEFLQDAKIIFACNTCTWYHGITERCLNLLINYSSRCLVLLQIGLVYYQTCCFIAIHCDQHFPKTVGRGPSDCTTFSVVAFLRSFWQPDPSVIRPVVRWLLNCQSKVIVDSRLCPSVQFVVIVCN